jgi:hypothetical protein
MLFQQRQVLIVSTEDDMPHNMTTASMSNLAKVMGLESNATFVFFDIGNKYGGIRRQHFGSDRKKDELGYNQCMADLLIAEDPDTTFWGPIAIYKRSDEKFTANEFLQYVNELHSD